MSNEKYFKLPAEWREMFDNACSVIPTSLSSHLLIYPSTLPPISPVTN